MVYYIYNMEDTIPNTLPQLPPTQSRKNLYGFQSRDVDQRRVPEGENRKTYEIKQLWQRSHEIINLAVRGYKSVDIAEILSITPATVSNTLNSELGELKLSELRQGRDEEAKKVGEKIRVLTNRAINTYNEIFDNSTGEFSAEDKRKTADNIMLELSGLRAPTKIQSQTITTQLTSEELESFKNRGNTTQDTINANIKEKSDEN